MKIDSRIREAQNVLAAFDMDEQRANARSACALLALLRLRPEDSWADAGNPMLGTKAIMDWIRDHYDQEYAANTRETIRRFTLHQFAEALLVKQNPDEPGRPVNSPKWNYQVTHEALTVIQQYQTSGFEKYLDHYLEEVPGLKAHYAASREMERISVVVPGSHMRFALSPGGQNVLIKQIVEDFCPLFTPGAEVLYVGDADSKWAQFDEGRFAELGVTFDQHGKMPDLVVYLPDKNWLVLVEAVTSHGPVDAKRHRELAKLFSQATPGLVYVSCFPRREEMRQYLPNIAWETEVWCADNPTHMIHFDGQRFLGPYE